MTKCKKYHIRITYAILTYVRMKVGYRKYGGDFVGKKVKVISGNNIGEFERQLESTLESFEGEYTIQFSTVVNPDDFSGKVFYSALVIAED